MRKDVVTTRRILLKLSGEALDIARTEGAVRAVLQVRSPSCGCGMIYDGTFSGALVPGKGVAAELLEKNGVEVYESTRTGKLLDEEGAL